MTAIVPAARAATASQPASRVREYAYATKIINAASPSQFKTDATLRQRIVGETTGRIEDLLSGRVLRQ